MDPAAAPGRREYGLDWLRVIAFGILILYHSGMPFVSWGWHIENGEKSRALELIMLFFNRWRLPLLFFISGCGVWFSLRRRGWGEFARERLRRLGIPLVFGMFVVVPPQIYCEHLWRGRSYSGYVDFYRTVLELVPYPQGSFSWHHLWFVVYVLVYSLAAIPMLAWIRGAHGRAAVARLASWCEKRRAAVYLINLPSIACALLLGPRWPVTHNLIADWANLTGSLITFLWGFTIASEPRLLDLIRNRRREFLAGGLAAAVLFYAVITTGVHLGPRHREAMTVLNAYFGMLWIFAMIGYARALLDRPGARLAYLNEAVYPFYIIHQTITVAAAYLVVTQPWSLWIKLALVVAATAGGSWAVFETARRSAVTRLLFGMKTGSRSAA